MIEGSTPTPENHPNESPDSDLTPEQPTHPSLALSEEQISRLHGALTLMLSAPLNLDDEQSRNHVAGLLEKALTVEDLNILPQTPFHPDSLIAGSVISDLQELGWQLHGSFEAVMDILVSPTGLQKMQFEHGGSPLSSRPEKGQFFFIAQGEGTQEIWDERYSAKLAQLKSGQEQIVNMASERAPSLVPILKGSAWNEIPAETLEKFCREHSREVMLLAWNFKKDFADKLLLG